MHATRHGSAWMRWCASMIFVATLFGSGTLRAQDASNESVSAPPVPAHRMLRARRNTRSVGVVVGLEFTLATGLFLGTVYSMETCTSTELFGCMVRAIWLGSFGGSFAAIGFGTAGALGTRKHLLDRLAHGADYEVLRARQRVLGRRSLGIGLAMILGAPAAGVGFGRALHEGGFPFAVASGLMAGGVGLLGVAGTRLHFARRGRIGVVTLAPVAEASPSGALRLGLAGAF